MQLRKGVSIAAILLTGTVTCVGTPAFATEAEPEVYALEDLREVEAISEVEQVLLLPDGRDIAIPDPGMEVSFDAATAEGALEVPRMLVTASPEGEVGVKIGEDTFGSSEGVAHLEQVDETLSSREQLEAVSEPPVEIRSRIAREIARCTDWDGKLSGHSWGSRLFAWRYNPHGEKGLGSVDSLQRAADTWTGSLVDACGNTDYSSLRTRYLGTTTVAPLLTGSGGCARYSSGANTVGWGTLPDAYLAVTCTYSIGAKPSRSDQMYNTNLSWNTGSDTACSGETYDLQGVATHEFGHTFGLGHARMRNDQVMKPFVDPCDSTMRTLGQGDIRGITALYS